MRALTIADLTGSTARRPMTAEMANAPGGDRRVRRLTGEAFSDSQGQAFHLRAATRDDVHLVRTWLPDAIGGTPPAMVTIATDALSGEVAGIAALRVFHDRVGRFLLFVNPVHRRRGCGTALLTQVRQIALQAEATRLLTGRSVDANASDEASLGIAAFLAANGMSIDQEIVHDRADLRVALAALGPLFQRYSRGSATDRRPRIVAAADIDPRALAQFAVCDVGGIPEEIADRLRGKAPAYCLRTSHVALVDDAIVGAVLTRRQGSAVLIETRVVAADHRGSGVNLALMHHGLLAAEGLGAETIEFEHDRRELDTAKLARRFEAVEVGRRVCWGCPLTEAPAEVPCSDWRDDALRFPLVDGLKPRELQERLFADSANDVMQILHARGIARTSLVSLSRGLTLQLNLVRHGTGQPDRTTGLRSCLLLAVLPKSASLYAFETLAAGLGVDRVSVCSHQFPGATINPPSVARLAIPGTICHSHIDGRLGNLAAINTFLDRLVVHVRDPRQALLSAVHHLNHLRSTKGASHVAGFGVPLPGDYFDLPLTEQIDVMVEHGLPAFVAWIESWLDAAANPLFKPRVLFTRYEDLHADPDRFFRSILDFYEVGWRAADFQPPPAARGTRHFRKGLKDEWRSVLTTAQCEAASAQLPPRLLDRFDWPAR